MVVGERARWYTSLTAQRVFPFPPSILKPFAMSSQCATLVAFGPTTPRTTGGSPPTGKPTSASIVPSARRPFPTQAPLARLSAQKNVFVFCPRGRVVRRPRVKSSLREDEKNSSLATRRSSNPRARRLASVARRRERRAARVASFVIRRRRHVRRAPQPPPSSPHPRPRNARLSHHAFRVVCAYDPGAGIIPGVRMYP